MSDTPRLNAIREKIRTYPIETQCDYFEEIAEELEKELQIVTAQRDMALALSLKLEECIEMEGCWLGSKETHAKLHLLRKEIDPSIESCWIEKSCNVCSGELT